jgi:hypothetical protein
LNNNMVRQPASLGIIVPIRNISFSSRSRSQCCYRIACANCRGLQKQEYYTFKGEFLHFERPFWFAAKGRELLQC